MISLATLIKWNNTTKWRQQAALKVLVAEEGTKRNCVHCEVHVIFFYLSLYVRDGTTAFTHGVPTHGRHATGPYRRQGSRGFFHRYNLFVCKYKLYIYRPLLTLMVVENEAIQSLSYISWNIKTPLFNNK